MSVSRSALLMAGKVMWGAARAVRPPRHLTVSEWADENRVLSPESSAEPGKWHTSRAPYQRGVMDAVNDPMVETVVMMSSAQIGKTEMVNNIAGYMVDHDPAPMLLIQPTLDMAQTWSKDRLAPMCRDTACLRGKLRDVKSRTSENTILHKVFVGGHLTVAGANSAASLASRPVRVVLADEVDRYPVSAGTEGDPVRLAFKRCATFWNKKKVVISTPSLHGASKIEAFYEDSDQRKFFVPCPGCGKHQVLTWKNVKWDKEPDGKHLPETARILCEYCGAGMGDADKPGMLAGGEWRATAAFKGTAGFHINELYSPWVSLREMVAGFITAKRSPDTLQVFINTSLGEPWDEGGEVVDTGTLYGRREKYGEKLPGGVVLLTVGVDVQDDRIEAEVVGWGRGEESWGCEFKVFRGDPARPQIWLELDEWLKAPRVREDGVPVTVASTAIDSGGHYTQTVYKFCKERAYRRVYAVKGSNQPGKPIVSRPSRTNAFRASLFTIGTDTAKAQILGRLRIDEVGPSFMHFPIDYDEEWFRQLTAEKLVTRFSHGKSIRRWVKTRARNEALDIRVYATAALYILNANLDRLADAMEEEAVGGDVVVEKPDTSEVVTTRPQRSFLRGGGRGKGFVNRW